MARIVQNDKGFKVIALSNEECKELDWGIMMDTQDSHRGMICMHCNNIIKGEVYYIAVLNDVMDKECYERWYAGAKHYSDDVFIENRNFNYYREALGL